MERMTKKYFLDLVIAKCDREVSDRFASMFIDVITDVLKNAMKDNTVVSIPPLGVFKPVFKPPRESYIPSTGEKLLLPAKIVVKFLPSKQFKHFVNTPDF